MHTIDAAETVGRLVEFFPSVKQPAVRQILAGVLRGVISQRLLPRMNGGRVVACEVMFNTARIADLIRDPDKTADITVAVSEGGFHLMQTFNQHLVQLVLDGVVEEEIGSNASSNRHDFQIAIQQAKRQRDVQAREAAERAFIEEGEAEAEEKPPRPKEVSGLRLA
jgi:twitching motility protein PilT